MSQSISFDRAASFYDATLKLPEDIAAAINTALLAEIRRVAADRVLEVGVGTGRIARPLMAEGVRVTGVDIAAQMMAQLVTQLNPAHEPPDLLLGDATRLPFRDASFRTVLAVHVFHLVASAADAIAEVRRVLAPGGVLLQQTRHPDAETLRVWDEHEDLWDGLAAEHGFQRRHQVRDEELNALLTSTGATLSEVTLLTTDHASTVADEVEALRTRRNSWSWDVPESAITACLPRYEAFLNSQFPEGRFADRVTYVIQVARWE